MLPLFQLDLKSRKSIYEQIVDHIKELIITGYLKTDCRLPSVRQLSRMLTVNPNTIQKAYRELERQGFLYSVSGLGSFVAHPEGRPRNDKKIKEIKENIGKELKELWYLGVSTEEIRKFIEGFLGKEEDNFE